MTPTTRRTALKQAALGTAAWALTAADSTAAASDRIRVGLIGAGGMGSSHLSALASRKDVLLTHVCDPDKNRLAAGAKIVQGASGRAPEAVTDLRRVLDDKGVDAVVIATPDHWHAPASILALDAGKHVYVEKPCCHNIREGRLMADAVRRSGKLLQVGTQSRSTACVRDAIDRVRDGQIGEVLVAKAWNSQLRANIGHAKPSEPPAGLDYDQWVGPAEMVPYQANMIQYGCEIG